MLRSLPNQLLKNRNLWILAAGSAAVVFIVSFVLYTVFRGLDEGLYFRGYAADGSFQTYNPLRRLDAGQVIGRDFQFFHGIGIPLSLLPLFKLLGANLFAAEFTRWVICGLAFLATAYIFFWALFRNWRRAFFGTALLTALVVALTNMVQPTNSLLALRTAMPLLVAALLALNWQREISFRRLRLRAIRIVMPVLLALSFLFSTEHGIYTIFAYFLLLTLLLLKRFRWRVPLRQIALLGGEVALLGVSTLLLFALATSGHPFEPISYALKTIPSEQFWYFGTPPNNYLSWSNLPNLLLHLIPLLLLITAIAAVCWLAYSRKLVSPVGRHFRALAFISLYGLASAGSMLGYASISQLYPLIKCALVVFVAVAIPLFYDIFTSTKKRDRRLQTYSKFLLAVSVLGLLGGSGYSIYRIQQMEVANIFNDAPHAPRQHDTAFGAKTHWAIKIGDFPELTDITQGEIWSTYTSYYDSNAGTLNPSKDGFDYIIHALGKENFEAYVEQFKNDKPKYVVTMKPSYLWYEQWLWTSNWEFYSNLLNNYALIKDNEAHYLWEYRGPGVTEAGDWQEAAVRDDHFALPKATSDFDLYEVRITYDAQTTLDALPRLPRYLVKPNDTALQYPVALPPEDDTRSFVVPVSIMNTKPTLTATADGLIPFAKLKIVSAEYRRLDTPAASKAPLMNNAALCSWSPDDINTIYVPCYKVRYTDRPASILGIRAPCYKNFSCNQFTDKE